jgi:WD40 repeat protein
MKTLAKEPRSLVLAKHPEEANCLFSPDGKTVVSLGYVRTVTPKNSVVPIPWGGAKMWDVASRKCRAVLDWDEPIGGVTFSPDGNLLAIDAREKVGEDRLAAGLLGDGIVILYKMKTKERVTVIKWGDGNGIGSGIFSPDGKTIAAVSTQTDFVKGQTNGQVLIFEVPSGKLRRTLEMAKNHSVHALEFSPDGKTLAAGLTHRGEYGKKESIYDTPSIITLWDAATGKVRVEYKELKGIIRSVAFSPDGKLLAIGGELGKKVTKTILGDVLGKKVAETILWDVTKGERRATLTSRGPVLALAFSHDGKLLATGGGNQKEAELKLWDVKTRREIRSLKGHKDLLTSVAFSPDDSMLVTGSRDGTVRLWYLRQESQPTKGKQDR